MQIKLRELIEKLPHRLFGVIGILIFYHASSVKDITFLIFKYFV